jgi:hypothetical protein
MGRRVLVQLFKLELRFVRLKEIAEFLRRIEQAHPLLVVERYGETAKTVDTDTALLAYLELHAATALLPFKFCDSRLQFLIRWFGHAVTSRVCLTLGFEQALQSWTS